MKKIKKYIISIFTILIILYSSNYSAAENFDKIHFLETEGCGDAIILQSNGKFALVDCGEDFESNAILINNYLRSLGATKLDYFIMTHAHSDHIGGFEKLSKLIGIDKFIGMDLGIDKNSILRNSLGEPIKSVHPFYDKKNNSWMVPEIEVNSWKTDIYYQKLIISLANQGIEKDDPSRFIVPKEGSTIKIGNYTLEFNNTFSTLKDIPEIKNNFNASSTWINIYKDDVKIVLSGDIIGSIGDYIVDKYNIENVDLYKIAHHCNTENTTENMIRKMNPKISVAMGVSNETPVATLLSLYGSEVYFTKDNSNIISATVYSNKISLDKEYKTHSTYLNYVWLKYNGKYYYYQDNTPIKNKWHKDSNGKWYWLKSEGDMASNEWELIDGKWYRFSSDGEMLEKVWYKDNNGKWYWLKSEGDMAFNEWELIDGKWYRFNVNGEMLKNTWYKNVDQKWYWLKENGEMASNESINIDGVYYEFSNNGCMIDM